MATANRVAPRADTRPCVPAPQFNATKPCCANDLTMNTLLYDLANEIIIDKSGRGVADIRAHALRIPLGPTETYAMWSATGITAGGEELRYLKFWLRAEAAGRPHTHDPAELAFVVASLRTALRSNAEALRGFWLGYTLKAQLADAKGLHQLRRWVEAHGGTGWWAEQWLPLLSECAAPEALAAVRGDTPAAKPAAKPTGPKKVDAAALPGKAAVVRRGARAWPWAPRWLRSPPRVKPLRLAAAHELAETPTTAELLQEVAPVAS